jgi:isoleucyl-tRNA synthetase
VLNEIFESLVKLLAPLIPFTAEEAWQFAGRKDSVHVQLFPEAKSPENTVFPARWEKLLALRSQVNEQLEQARQKKEIGKSLEARVVLSEIPENVSSRLLTELFIVSQLEMNAGAPSLIQITKAKGQKCERCWKYDEQVGSDAEHPTLCPRCATVVRGLGVNSSSAL